MKMDPVKAAARAEKALRTRERNFRARLVAQGLLTELTTAQQKHAEKVAKVKAMADDPRIEETVRKVARSRLKIIKAQAPKRKPQAHDLPPFDQWTKVKGFGRKRTA